MNTTINNLYFEYDDKAKCINAYDALTNSLVSYIHVNKNEVKDTEAFENVCERWASTVAGYNILQQGVDYNSWY